MERDKKFIIKKFFNEYLDNTSVNFYRKIKS